MGNCVVTKAGCNNKSSVVRQIKSPGASSLFSQETIILDEHEWELIQDAHKQCRKGDEALKNGNLESALKNYKLMLHIPPQLQNSEIAGLYIQQIGEYHLFNHHYDDITTLFVTVLTNYATHVIIPFDSLRLNPCFDCIFNHMLAMGSSAKVYMLQQNYLDATKLYELALNIAIDIEDKKGEAIILLQLATINKKINEHKKAEKQCRNAVSIFREIGDRTMNEAIALLNLGSILRILGNHQSSRECYVSAKEIFRENGSVFNQNISENEIKMPQEISLE